MSARTASVASQHSPLQRRFERLAGTARPACIEGLGSECAVEHLVDAADLGEILVGEDRLGDFEPLVRSRMMAKQVGARADHRHQAHHHRFADWVDWRVRDLRKVLLEIVVKQLGSVGQRRDWRVRAHRPDGILAICRHRREEELQILVGITECFVRQFKIGLEAICRFGLRRRRQFLELELGLAQASRHRAARRKGGI